MAESTRRDGIQCTYKGETHEGALVRTGHSIEFHGPLRRLRIQRVESLGGDGAAGKKITIAIMFAMMFVTMSAITFQTVLFLLTLVPIGAASWVVIRILARDTGWINIYGQIESGDYRKWRVRDRQKRDTSLWDFLAGIEARP